MISEEVFPGESLCVLAETMGSGRHIIRCESCKMSSSFRCDILLFLSENLIASREIDCVSSSGVLLVLLDVFHVKF